MPKEHLLKGLEPDNLLAFLALLGFHRCLSHARTDWNPRVFWDGVPLRPWIVLAAPVERDELLEAAVRAANDLAEVHSFDRPNLDYSVEQARQEFTNALLSKNHARIDLLSALMSDAAARDDKVRATPFCAMFGQGHQNFLERLEKVPKGLPPKELQGESRKRTSIPRRNWKKSCSSHGSGVTALNHFDGTHWKTVATPCDSRTRRAIKDSPFMAQIDSRRLPCRC